MITRIDTTTGSGQIVMIVMNNGMKEALQPGIMPLDMRFCEVVQRRRAATAVTCGVGSRARK
jgi:hypothetical protein